MTSTTIKITLETVAAEALQILMKESDKAEMFLRVWVTGGGCSGLNYGMALETTQADDDIMVTDKDVNILVDSLSAQYLDGITIQYYDDSLGGGFKIDNPNVKHSCGCGSSFNIEEQQPSEERCCQGCGCQ